MGNVIFSCDPVSSLLVIFPVLPTLLEYSLRSRWLLVVLEKKRKAGEVSQDRLPSQLEEAERFVIIA